MLTRRDALKTLGAAGVASIGGLRLQAQEDRDAVLAAIAEIVLPAEADRKAAVAAFAEWIDSYKEGADTDHGYGNTRIRATGPSPARKYPAQIAALDSAARAKGAAGFIAAPLADRRVIVEQAIADAKIDRLPSRPTGGHVATDLMGHYFNSASAEDLCYRAQIGRDACRGLAGSENPPKAGSYRAQASDRVGDGARVSAASEPRARSEPAKRRASERVGESEGRRPSVNR